MMDFRVNIYEKSKRGKEIRKVFGTTTLNIKSPIPEWIILPNKEKALAYYLDLDLITDRQREKLISHLSSQFNQPIEFVRDNLDKIGVPILKKDCLLIIKNPQKWF